MKTVRAAAGAVTRPSTFKEMVLGHIFSFPWQTEGGVATAGIGNIPSRRMAYTAEDAESDECPRR